MFIGLIFFGLLMLLAGWQILYRWRVYRHLQTHGRIVEARVTDIKREAHLAMAVGISSYQRLKYEDFLYAQWQDSVTQHCYNFRIKIPDFYLFHVGEPVFIQMNPHNPSECRLHYRSSKRSVTKRPVPKSEVVYQEYEQGYQATTPPENISAGRDIEYEQPQASYPQQLPEQKQL